MARSCSASLAAAIVLGIVSLAVPSAAAAGSLTVAPTTIELNSSHDIAVLHLSNDSDAPVVAQVEGFDWSQQEGRDKFVASASLIVSPPMAKLAPGREQIIRLQAPRANGASESSYRLFVTQLPDPGAARKPGVNLLLQFSVPVFVHAANPSKKANVAFSAALKADGLWISARNDSNQHAKFTRIDLVGAAHHRVGMESGLFYILPGAEHRWRFANAGVANGEPVRIEAQDATGGPSIVADVVVHSD